jgi:hypothetical protein
MWIPTDAREIEEAARGGRLIETPSFDAKADLPAQSKNSDLAKDVAAMATDGGVLLYGVAEDEHGNPTLPEPIGLKGAPERVSEIVSTSIAEVPFIDVRTFPLSDDPSRGYLVVVVPQSSRAPHMVIVRRDNRFYGRGANGNRMLQEGDVARLYERRQGWEIDRFEVLDDAIELAPAPPKDGQSYVHAYARPVTLEKDMYARAVAGLGGPEHMHERLIQCVHTAKLSGIYSPTLEQAHSWRRYSADLWRLSTRDETLELSGLNIETPQELAAYTGWLTSLVHLNLYLDGYGRLFCGRATDTRLGDSSTPLMIEVVIAGNIEAFFTVMSMLYEAAGYHGTVDVGIAVTGIKGSKSYRANRSFNSWPAYPSDRFTRTDRVAAGQLKNADVVAYELLHDLFDATTGQEGWNPWTQPQNR